MDAKRVDPPKVADELRMLSDWLDYERGTLVMKCHGLSTEQLRERTVPPSPLSLLGIVRHMTDVERGWFSRGVAGEQAKPIYYSEADPDGDFNNLDELEPAKVLSAWEEECERSRRHVAAAGSPDTMSADGRGFSARWIMIHMIEEYARHNGHADFLRERIDGQTGE